MNRNNMLIEADELLTKLGNPNVRIFDATILFFRKESDLTANEAYLQRHIPGAAFFDHQEFSDSSNKYMYMVLPEAALAKQIGSIGISAASEVIFYTSDLLPCATRAWWLLRYAGHNNVRVLNGGLAAWEAAGGKIASGGHSFEAAQFACQIRPEMFASKEEVKAALNDSAVCTVNTLDRNSYEQAHITGSTLLPCTTLMHEMNSFLPDDELTAHLKEEAGHERIITYCGGGIAATVNAMAHLLAGNPNIAVYDGSMDEWVGDGMPTISAAP